MTTKLRLSPLILLLLVYAIFSAWAQWRTGLGMDLSPIQLAGMQPKALWQGSIGLFGGGLLGFRAGIALHRAWHMRAAGLSDTMHWARALGSMMPWVVATGLSIEGYEQRYFSESRVVDVTRAILPLSLAFSHGFKFGLAAGLFWAENPILFRHKKR